ncbi:MAG: hypothetical protein ABJL67_05305 [Sulfitobacter sp.]
MTFVDDALDCLKQLALELVSGDLPWKYSAAFLAASEVPEVGFAGSAESQHVHYLGFRNALWSIAWDIHLIGLKGKSDPRIVNGRLNGKLCANVQERVSQDTQIISTMLWKGVRA